MRPWLARRWKSWRHPSLMRRLLLAQMGVVCLLWTLAMAALIYDEYKHPEMLESEQLFRFIVSLTDNLADHPERRREALKALDGVLEDAGTGDAKSAPILQVWQRGDLIHRTSEVEPLLVNTTPNQIETVSAGGRRWRARTWAASGSDITVLLAEPGVWSLAVTIANRGYYLLPLVISLPFLVFPAWISVRVALRPWWRVSKETAERGPADLTPLAYSPPHSELQPLVQSINSLLQRLRDSTSRERSLVADAAHELRTPLAAVRVNAEALKAQTIDERQRELMDNLLRSNERASRLASQLLQLMRSDAASDSGLCSAVPFDALVQDRLAMIEGLAHARGVELELVCDEGVSVFGERDGLASMIDNLVDNAIKYSRAGKQVTVQVRRDAHWALLSVADEGPGIPHALRERVFDRFYRCPDQTESGSGLGLAIVKSVIDKHGGQILLAESPAGGLLATVRLPAANGFAGVPLGAAQEPFTAP